MSDSMSAALAPRIALMHHHALPTPYSDVREGLTSFEPFLVLRNAGTLLKELTRNDFNIVLHGHKHYSSFMRLGYTNQQDVEGELAVIAAGSTGVTHAEAGRNSINIIETHSNGYMLHVPVFYGAAEHQLGGDTADAGQADPPHPDAEAAGVPTRVRGAGAECSRLERSVAIDAWGWRRWSSVWSGFRRRDDQRTDAQHQLQRVTGTLPSRRLCARRRIGAAGFPSKGHGSHRPSGCNASSS